MKQDKLIEALNLAISALKDAASRLDTNNDLYLNAIQTCYDAQPTPSESVDENDSPYCDCDNISSDEEYDINKCSCCGKMLEIPLAQPTPSQIDDEPVAKDYKQVAIDIANKYKFTELDLCTKPQPTSQDVDAERYRWLRHGGNDLALVIDKRTDWVPPDDLIEGVGGHWEYEYRAGKELDDAIDAAMKESK